MMIFIWLKKSNNLSNDDLFSTATTSSHTQTSSQKKASNRCQEWLCQARQPQPTFAKLSTSTTLLKGTPLTITVVWMGKGGKEFE